jgi:hypothetical protein
MSHNHTRTAISGGNLRRSRVVYMSTDFTVLEMSVATSFQPYGVTQEYSRKAPGTPFDTSLFAAASGDEVLIYGAGATALAECGGTVTAGKRVTVDSTARVVDSVFAGGLTSLAISMGWEVGLALESGAAGDVVRVEVNPSRGYIS